MNTRILLPPAGLDAGEYRLRVLLSAVTCDPYRGSEPGCGWGRAVETAKHFDVWVICGEGESAIRQWLADHGEISSLHFHFLPPTSLEKRLLRVPGMLYVAYNLWQRRACRLAMTLHDEFHFDIVHQVNLATFREPGYLWKLRLPFVWGPFGGIENFPWRFLWNAGPAGAFTETLRNIANAIQFRYSRRIRSTARKADALLTVNSLGKESFKHIHGVNPIQMLDLGTSAVGNFRSERGKRQGPLRILWIGSFLHKKALHLLIEAFRRLPDGFRYELRILGRGPLEKRWRRLAHKAGMDPYCRWMGWLPREEALAQYEWADFLVFTSLRDACGSVVPESLSHGLPVVCLDHQGASDIVTVDCGIKIPVTTPGEVAAQLRDIMVSLERNRGKLDEMSAGAIERSQEFLWSRKIEQTARIYLEILSRRTSGTIVNPGIRGTG